MYINLYNMCIYIMYIWVISYWDFMGYVQSFYVDGGMFHTQLDIPSFCGKKGTFCHHTARFFMEITLW